MNPIDYSTHLISIQSQHPNAFDTKYVCSNICTACEPYAAEIDNSVCASYGKGDVTSNLYFTIYLPTGCAFLFFICCLFWQLWKKRKPHPLKDSNNDDMWLLSCNRLKRPSLPQLPNSPSLLMSSPVIEVDTDTPSTKYKVLPPTSPLVPYSSRLHQFSAAELTNDIDTVDR